MSTASFELADWFEGRRLRAFELSQQGWRPVRIAEALGVSRAAVSQWLEMARRGGADALRARPHQGASARLTNGASFKSQSEHWRIRHRNIGYDHSPNRPL